ncbi:MAG: thioredoxin [Acidobacteria bacterium]|nr:thioredoxin [Acidobacteriota bacterium]
MAETTLDVTRANFEREVLERSRQVAVVVDFWAPWCAPCKILAPALERAVAATGGKALLAKINVDDEPELAAAFGVQSIPMVVAFRDGQPVAQFVGAQPPHVVEAWVAQLVPTAAETALAEARRHLAEGRLAEAERALRDEIARNARDGEALLELGRLLAQRGDAEQALAVLDQIPPGTPEADLADRERLLLQMIAAGSRDPGPATDAASRWARAGERWRGGRPAEAMDELLEIVRHDRSFLDDGARRALLAIFDRLGPADPVVDQARNRLGMILFS